MEKLQIDNINIYKSFKQSGYTIESAIAEFVDNSVNAFTNQTNKTIIIYWNADDRWLQIIDNANGIKKEDVPNLFRLFNGKNNHLGIGLKAAAFFLGSKIIIESKNTQQNFAFRTQFDLNNDVDSVPISYTSPDSILRSFDSATRITVDLLDKTISQERLKNLYFNLSKLFKNYINQDVNILLTMIVNKNIHDISEGKLSVVNSLNDIKKLTFDLPEYNESLTVNFDDEIMVNNKKYQIKGKAYKLLIQSNFNGIMLSNKHRTIIGSNNLYKPKWFDESFNNVLVDVSLTNVTTNVTKNWFIWDDELQSKIDSYIYEKVKHLQIKSVKKTESLIDVQSTRRLFVSDETESEHLENSCLYLTKALENSTNSFGDDFEIIKNKLHFVYNCDDGKKIAISLNRRKEKNKLEWLQLIPISQDDVQQNYEYEVVYNVAHPFFKPFDNDKNFSHRMEHFVIAYAISETICRLDGLNVNDLKYEISKLLKGMEDDDF